ncbi:MAG TPA: cyclase family protein [Bryobacteraceae bacterium]|nr:cyclase family protein [Bryobacteraceae bacterium]
MNAGRIVDLSQPVCAGTPVFPGDGPVRITVLDRETTNLSRIALSVHTGTHMDAPFHFFHDADTIDRIGLDRCAGPARLIDVRGIGAKGEIRGEHIKARLRAPLRAHAAILYTGWSAKWEDPRYFADHPCLAADAAQFLVDCGVHLVGVDMPSVDRAPYPAHQILLRAGVPIVENLTNLEAIGADLFRLLVLPLKLAGRDASPVRAVAIVEASLPGRAIRRSD